MLKKTEEPKKNTVKPLTEEITRKNFWEKALKFIQDNYTAENRGKEAKIPTIKPETGQWDVWRQYFERHLGFMPVTMQEVLLGRREAMTVPMEYPQNFDLNFREDPDWKPSGVVQRPPTDKEMEAIRATRESYDELKARHGGNDWGISNPVAPIANTRELARQKLQELIGEDAFRAIPEAPLPPNWK